MSDQTPNHPENESLLTFPCDFPIKIFGLANDQFESTVLMILRKHVPTFTDTSLQIRASANGKYSAISVTLPITSKAQLDAIYCDLTAASEVLMAL